MLENDDAKDAPFFKKNLELFILNKNNYIIIILFWVIIGAASSLFRVNHHKDETYRRAEIRGQLLCQVLLTSHFYAPKDLSYQDNSFDGSFIRNLNFDMITKSNYDFDKTTYRITTTYSNKYNSAISDRERAWLQDPEIVSGGRLDFNLKNIPSFAIFTKPIVTNESCVDCHLKLGKDELKLGETQMGVIITFPAHDFLMEYQKNTLNNIITDAIICSVLAFITIAAMYVLRTYYLRLQATTSQIIESEKMASLGAMVAGFSHELKTPIGIAVAAASQVSETTVEIKQLFKREEISEEEVMEPLATLSDSSQLISTHLERAYGMIREFRSTANDFSFDGKKILVLRDLFNEIQIDMRHLYKNNNLTVHISCPSKLNIYASIGSLKQILYNLYANAIKYAFLDGTLAGIIHIDCALVDGKIRIVFSDDGCGMDNNIVKHIFEPFFTTGRNDGGTGLGLFIVHTIVTKEFSGTIQCRSALGHGTTFEILLPYLKQTKPQT